MINIEKTDVFGWESAIRGMRNPLNSWSKSDSDFTFISPDGDPHIGENDLNLMRRLVNSGSDHGKFMRMINVTADITAPMYWWKEYDTYKVGTVANSCSTMHTIHKKEFTLDDFSHEHLCGDSIKILDKTIEALNFWRDAYMNHPDADKKEVWWQMIQLLPSSYNQKRTVQLNYQVLKNIYPARKAHKLDEWHDFCDWIESLPHSELITCNFD